MSNKRHKYFNKVPPFKPDTEHYTRKHRSWKAKAALRVAIRNRHRRLRANIGECIDIPVLSSFTRIGKNWNTYRRSSD